MQNFRRKENSIGSFCVSGNSFRSGIFSCGTRSLKYFRKSFLFMKNVYLLIFLINDDNVTGR